MTKRGHDAYDSQTSSRKKNREADEKIDYEFYDSEYEDMKNCNRANVPTILPSGNLCKHCGEEGDACSRIRFGKYVITRCIAIEESLEWERMYVEYSSIYYEAVEFAKYIDNPEEYKAKFIDIEEYKDCGEIDAEWVPECMSDLFYAFKYFHFDNCHKKNYKWGKKGLKLFFNKYDTNNRMK